MVFDTVDAGLDRFYGAFLPPEVNANCMNFIPRCNHVLLQFSYAVTQTGNIHPDSKNVIEDDFIRIVTHAGIMSWNAILRQHDANPVLHTAPYFP